MSRQIRNADRLGSNFVDQFVEIALMTARLTQPHLSYSKTCTPYISVRNTDTCRVKNLVKQRDFQVKTFLQKKLLEPLRLNECDVTLSKLFLHHILRSHNILYNAPYSPHLNPIELAFGHIKQEIRRNPPHNQDDLISRLFQASKAMNISLIRAFFYSSIKYLETSLKGYNLL